MTDVYSFYTEILGTLNKEENGYFKVSLFNTYLISGGRKIFNDYQAKLQHPDTAAIEKQRIKDLLNPFFKNLSIVAASGFFLLPGDYSYFDNCRTNFDNGKSLIELYGLYADLCEAETNPTINAIEVQTRIDEILQTPDFVTVELLDSDQITKRMQSAIHGKAPHEGKPVMERSKNGMQIYPQTTASVVLHYYRRPVPGKLVMTIDPDTLDLVYDSTNSIQIEWPDEALSDLALEINNKFAIYVREKDLFQMNQVEKQAKP